MKVTGTHTIAAPRARVWELLNDPDVLARTTPGIVEMVAEREGRYRATLELGIGPVKGRFQGHLEVTEQEEPEAMTLSVEGQGGPGGVKAAGRLQLKEEGDTTIIHYEGEPQLTGRLASVGARLLTGVAKKMAGQFFSRLEQEA
ncbi:MAG: carbon monoxide dehydrogenase subunit G [Truepera sp.]|nr:carbon monoxide dehydrogenase subunit G [Truepera sp.]